MKFITKVTAAQSEITAAHNWRFRANGISCNGLLHWF